MSARANQLTPPPRPGTPPSASNVGVLKQGGCRPQPVGANDVAHDTTVPEAQPMSQERHIDADEHAPCRRGLVDRSGGGQIKGLPPTVTVRSGTDVARAVRSGGAQACRPRMLKF